METKKLNFKKKYKPFHGGLLRPEAGRPYGADPQETDVTKIFEKEGSRLGLIFNGMQNRSHNQPPIPLFTDKKTKSTFGVEPGQNIKSKLIEVRKRFSSFKVQLEG